jgi:phage major head subunit gpT-like protein
MGHDADIRNAMQTVNRAYTTTVDEIFSRDLPGAHPAYTQIINSNGNRSWRTDFLGFSPTVREWLGSKEINQFRAYNHTITLTKYESTVQVDRMDVKYDNIGVVSAKLGAFARQSAGIYDKLAFAALVANGTGYDGVSLYNASHPHGNSTNSNTGTSTLSHENLRATIEAGASWQNEYGEPIGVAFDTMMVGPAKEGLAKDILQITERTKAVDATGAEATNYNIGVASIGNIYNGTMRLIVDPRMADGTRDDYWYLFDSSKEVKPIIGLVGEPPHAVIQDDMTDESRFMFDYFVYSVEADLKFAPGFWFTTYRQAATT